MKKSLLEILNITPSAQSIDYIKHKTQFQLHKLPTEQRHPSTWNLRATIRRNTSAGLNQIFAVDRDISRTLHKLASKPDLIRQAAKSVCRTVCEGRRIYIYGCGSTGRLAKQMESALWRPFWRTLLSGPLGPKVQDFLPPDIENLLTGEMTGGDRALISSLEGFEDLDLIGRLQMEDHGIKRGDMVFAITEGGETSSVIGTILAASAQYGTLTEASLRQARENLYFISNNPEETLRPFERSRSVLDHPAITKINLTTGPQAIAGSTRMQATTCETFVMGIILETGIQACLSRFLSQEEMASIGFQAGRKTEDRIKDFDGIREKIADRLNDIAEFTNAETATYREGGRTTYFAGQGLLPVFIDCSERSPTFHLHPLDTIDSQDRRSWVGVCTGAENGLEAWRYFLGRPFRGLSEAFYHRHFAEDIDDPYLREAALASLAKAGNDQEKKYDFSLSGGLAESSPRENDLGVLIAVDREIGLCDVPQSPFARFISFFRERGAKTVLILVGEGTEKSGRQTARGKIDDPALETTLLFPLQREGDPLGLNRQLILKMLLNGHSTGVMASLGRVVGNTMTHVNPSNLKLIGRATSLILTHVNETLSGKEWKGNCGSMAPISYSEANAVLFDAKSSLAGQGTGASEVELSIIRILEALKTGGAVSWKEAADTAGKTGLGDYLESFKPSHQ